MGYIQTFWSVWNPVLETPEAIPPENMIAYLTQNFPTIHGCDCGSGMSMLIEFHKAVRIMTCCLEWILETEKSI